MKKLTIGALLAAQLLGAAQPLAAEPLDDDRLAFREQQRGAFIGARFRVPFGGENSGQPRAALAFTAVDHGRNGYGGMRTRFAEGIELGLSPNRPLTLSIGGASFASRLAAAQGNEEPQPTDNRERQNRTGRVVLKGLAVAAIVTVAVIGGLYLAIVVACDGDRCDE